MAKPEIRPNKSKMTVVMFQLDGSDETVQDGLKTISQALGNAFRVMPAAMQLAAAPIKDEATPQPPGEEPVIVDEEAASEPENTSVSAPRNRTFKSPKILDHMNIKGAAVPLATYLESKKVGETDNKRYLAIISFLKEQLSVEEVSMDHIYTCYRLMGWNTPKDASMPLRNLKQLGSLSKGQGTGMYKLNHIGENALRDMAK